MYPIDAKDFRWEEYQNTFDVVVAADVLEHVDHLDSYLNNIYESLKEKGCFYLSGPTENWFYGLCRKIAGFTGEYHHRNIFDIENLLKEKGWEMIEIRSIPWFLPFKMFRISVWQKNFIKNNKYV
jgi:2-polyprenyl-3-methyl-5-hydroxy-6-metoxy-1,4-benzoquinol methylase